LQEKLIELSPFYVSLLLLFNVISEFQNVTYFVFFRTLLSAVIDMVVSVCLSVSLSLSRCGIISTAAGRRCGFTKR